MGYQFVYPVMSELDIHQDLGTFRSYFYSAMTELETEIYLGLLRSHCHCARCRKLHVTKLSKQILYRNILWPDSYYFVVKHRVSTMRFTHGGGGRGGRILKGMAKSACLPIRVGSRCPRQYERPLVIFSTVTLATANEVAEEMRIDTHIQASN
jgi:hypothetical protein